MGSKPSPRHLVTSSPRHLVTSSPRLHLVTTTPRHPDTPTPRQKVRVKLAQCVILALLSVLSLVILYKNMTFALCGSLEINGLGSLQLNDGSAPVIAWKGLLVKEMSQSLRKAKDEPEPLESPEPIDSLEICAEKCKHIPEMCDGLYGEAHWPAPKCNYRSTNEDGDYYAHDKPLASKRNEMTIRLVQWAAQRVRKPEAEGGVQCELHTVGHEPPMMFPEEFEMLVKTMARLQPEKYLEWGTGRSTSFYPLLNSGQVYAIDNYPPWCEIVSKDPVVSCIMNEQKRFQYICAAPVHEDGTPIATGAEGRPTKKNSVEEMQLLADQYLGALDQLDVNHLDAALIDGRLRVACALKVLNYVNEKSVVFVHDFWLRPRYHVLLEYYDVLGYARSLAVLRKKAPENLPVGWETAWKIHANMTTHHWI